MVRVEFKKLYEDSILPKKAHESDAGFDLYANSIGLSGTKDDGLAAILAPGQRCFFKCGFGMALPVGYEAQVRPRSGLALKHGISVVNSPGTIDAGYRDEVGVVLINLGREDFTVTLGDRIAQMVIQKLPDVEVVVVEDLSNPTDRGAAGFGSTGVN